MKLRLALPLLSAAALAACAKPADKAAKARVFSAEEPSPEALRAKEPVEVGQLATDAAVLHRVLAMDRAEATRRLGAHKAASKVAFTWTMGEKEVALEEQHRLETDAEGRFRAVSTTDAETGLEVVSTGSHVWVKSLYGPFRERRLDHAPVDAWKQRATDAAATLERLMKGRVAARESGTTRIEGHPAHKFSLTLGPAGNAAAGTALPPPTYGQWKDPADGQLKPGPDPDTARRLAFDEKGVPESLAGDLVVDDATGVVLGLHAKARFAVPAEGNRRSAALALALDFDVTPAADVEITPPEEVAATRLPHAPKDPLWFLGEARKKAEAEPDAGGDAAADDESEPAKKK
ncbi:MAG: hypothetical protein RL199_1035 [Pseudomonadota bacterium]|jgi:hypothetical protein